VWRRQAHCAAPLARDRRLTSRVPWNTGSIMRWHKIAAALCFGLISLSLTPLSRAADDQRARETVARVAQLYSSKSSIATLQMQISGEDGTRDLSMKIWTRGDNALVRIIRPEKDAGTAILKIGSDIWYYLPKANRTIKTPGSMTMTSWMGSDFTIDDLVKGSSLVHDYSVTTSFEGIRDGVPVYEYTLEPRPGAAVVWGVIVLRIRQADFMPIYQLYYDEDRKLVRELTFSGYKTMDHRLIPARVVMKVIDKPDELTTIEYKDVIFDAPISDETFSLDNLKR
jgi:outer membrane lipoprotein-sorting protein